ncbi:MAG: histidine kinase, partial [Alphaproteobacteria bacterium]
MAAASDISPPAERRERESDLVLGEDWIAGPRAEDARSVEGRVPRMVRFARSPLARKIVTFNLLGLVILVAGVLYLSPARDTLVAQRARDLASEARLAADVIEVQLPRTGPVSLIGGDGVDVGAALARLSLPRGVRVRVHDLRGNLVAETVSATAALTTVEGLSQEPPRTVLTDFLAALWQTVFRLFGASSPPAPETEAQDFGRDLLSRGLEGGTVVRAGEDAAGRSMFAVVTPIRQGEKIVGVLELVSAGDEIDALVRSEREQVLQMFVIALLVAVGLSLLLASTIANPIADLAAAAEAGNERGGRRRGRQRVR